jgi:tRNA pseudouridine32 synthase / 23S rRNA pseudouridine746 synthase
MTRPRPVWAPPARDGVSASRVAVHGGPWASVTEFLVARLPGADDWPARLARGEVLDSQGRTLAGDAACVPGMLLWYWRSLPPEPRIPFDIEVLHQDAHLVVVDKPHFLPVTPGGRYLQETVLVRLKRLLALDTLVPMHRLDLETAGVLLFMVQPDTRPAYQSLLRERRVHKVYEAVAPWREGLGLPRTVCSRLQERPQAFMQMQVVAGEPNAQTLIELIERLGPVTLGMADGRDTSSAAELAHYRLTPLSGRKHQLRAQLSELGLPICGDRIYPRLWPEPAQGAVADYTQPLQLLARELAFIDPLSGKPRRYLSRRHLALARQP